MSWRAKGIWQAAFTTRAAAGDLPAEELFDRTHVKAHRSTAGDGHGWPLTFLLMGDNVADAPKDAFSWVRAERMNWIGATLTDPVAVHYQGLVSKTRSYDPARRVDLLYEGFVVVLALGLNRDGALRANFITCYQTDNSVSKIRTLPLWTREACLNALR